MNMDIHTYICLYTYAPVQPDIMKSGVKANHYEFFLTLRLNEDEVSTSRSGRLYHSNGSIYWLIKSLLKPTIMDLGLMKIKYLRLSYDPFRPVPLQLRPFQSSSSPATTLSVQFPSSYDPFNPVPLQLRPFPSSSPPATTLSVQFPSSYDPFSPVPLQLRPFPSSSPPAHHFTSLSYWQWSEASSKKCINSPASSGNYMYHEVYYLKNLHSASTL